MGDDRIDWMLAYDKTKAANESLRSALSRFLGLKCPTCPQCGAQPALVLVGDQQAFCTDGQCQVLCWNPSLSALDNLAAEGVIDGGTSDE